MANNNKFWWIYRNYFPSKWPFFSGDTKNLYDQEDATNWYNRVKNYYIEIEINKPPRWVVKIKLPVKEWDVEEDKSLWEWIMKNKLEWKLEYILNEILNKYYYWIDECFHVRGDNTRDDDQDIVFTMKEVIEGMFRITPVDVRVSTDKDTQKINFVPWEIWVDVKDVSFTFQWKEYTTNFFWLYWARFREAIYPNSNFDWKRLQSWQEDMALKRGKITVVLAPRGSGKSKSNTEFVAEYLFKEINLLHEFDRPFLIVYGGLSKDQHLQVVTYLRAMAKSITTNKNILKWSKQDMTMTFFDWHNERIIKFVTQWQEGEWFTGLRPHLTILDESFRLKRRMFDVAIGTVESPIVMISTVDYETKKNWCYDIYKEAVNKQRNYQDINDLIKETWIKFDMHKVKSREELMKKVRNWDIDAMRNYFYSQRPMVGLKYTIDDVDRYTQEQKDELVERAMLAWEEVALAEYYSEIPDNNVIFPTDGRIESSIPTRFDAVSVWFDDAIRLDNPAAVTIWYVWWIAYVISSEILSKENIEKKREDLNRILTEARQKSSVVFFAADLSRSDEYGMREFENYVRVPDFPLIITSAKHWEIRRKRPYFLTPKNKLISITRDEFFLKNNIIFSSTLDIEEWIITELWNFKQSKTTIEYAKNVTDDQVDAMMISLFAIYRSILKNIKPSDIPWMLSPEERYDNFLISESWKVDMEEYEKKMSHIVNRFR